MKPRVQRITGLAVLFLLALSACHRHSQKTGRASRAPAPPPASASQIEGETVPADSVEVQPGAQALYHQDLEQAKSEIGTGNAWRELRAMERAIDDEREATHP